MIDKISKEEIRKRIGVANISVITREARPRWVGHVERKTEEDVAMRTWKMEVGWTPKDRKTETEVG